MSKVEVDQVDPQSGTTLTLGTSGDTVSIPSGVTLANAGTVTGIPTSALTGTIALNQMATGTDGNIISYDASGNPVAVATGSAGQILTSAGAGAPPTFAAAAASGITEADQWRLTTSFQGDATPLSSNLERVDTSGWGQLGTGMSVSSGIFTFPSTGIWLVKFRVTNNYTGANRYTTAAIQVTTNNSSYANIASGEQGIISEGNGNVYSNTLVETLIDCTNTSNVKVRFNIDVEEASTNTNGETDVTYTNMMFIRLGDT